MQYLLMIYEDERILEAMSNEVRAAFLQRYRDLSARMGQAGVLQGGNALRSVASATSVRVRNGTTTTTDGPFAETKEQLGGYFLVEVPDLDAALHWAAQIPSAENGTIEVRPIGLGDMSD